MVKEKLASYSSILSPDGPNRSGVTPWYNFSGWY